MDNGASSYRRFLSGDESALEEIVINYRSGLQNYINSIVKNVSVAEDLTEDTFVKLLIKKPRDRGEATFKTWLYTIGRNLAVDWLRKNPAGRAIPFEELEGVMSEEVQIEEICIRREEAQLLHVALGRLKPEYRQVLFLI